MTRLSTKTTLSFFYYTDIIKKIQKGKIAQYSRVRNRQGGNKRRAWKFGKKRRALNKRRQACRPWGNFVQYFVSFWGNGVSRENAFKIY